MPNDVGSANSSGSVARQQLLEDIMSLAPPQASILLSSRSVKDSVMAEIRKLKVMPSDPT